MLITSVYKDVEKYELFLIYYWWEYLIQQKVYMEHDLGILFQHICPRETHKYPRAYVKKIYTGSL